MFNSKSKVDIKMKPKVLVADKIHNDAIDELEKFAGVDLDFGLKPDELMKKIAEYDVLIVRSSTQVTKTLIDASNLKVVGRAGVGLDNIDVDAAEDKGITVVNAPESVTITVAEYAFGLMISVMRKISIADKSLKNGRWDRHKFMGTELHGKTIGIVGLGRIGREIARRARAFGMNILVNDPHITSEDAREFNAKVVELDELLENADVVTIHVPLIPKTKNLIDTRELKLMKESSILINTSRGGIINENSLYLALKNEEIGGAALDVFENEPLINSPLSELDNVVLTPHLGASTNEAQKKAGIVVVEKIKKIFKDE